MCVCVCVCVSIGLAEHTDRGLARVGLTNQDRTKQTYKGRKAYSVCVCVCVSSCMSLRCRSVIAIMYYRPNVTTRARSLLSTDTFPPSAHTNPLYKESILSPEPDLNDLLTITQTFSTLSGLANSKLSASSDKDEDAQTRQKLNLGDFIANMVLLPAGMAKLQVRAGVHACCCGSMSVGRFVSLFGCLACLQCLCLACLCLRLGGCGCFVLIRCMLCAGCMNL